MKMQCVKMGSNHVKLLTAEKDRIWIREVTEHFSYAAVLALRRKGSPMTDDSTKHGRSSQQEYVCAAHLHHAHRTSFHKWLPMEKCTPTSDITCCITQFKVTYFQVKKKKKSKKKLTNFFKRKKIDYSVPINNHSAFVPMPLSTVRELLRYFYPVMALSTLSSMIGIRQKLLGVRR